MGIHNGEKRICVRNEEDGKFVGLKVFEELS